MKQIESIVVHCSDSLWGDVDVIRKWHTDPPRNWRDIGYNLVICNGYSKNSKDYYSHYDGLIQEGRALDFDAYVSKEEKAAHTLGYNDRSIGICLIGKDYSDFTKSQYLSLYYVCKTFLNINRNINVFGHYEMSTARGKTCPNFDMNYFRQALHYSNENDTKFMEIK